MNYSIDKNKLLIENDSSPEQAHALGLTSAGWGYWKDSSGKTVAKTVKSNLVKLSPEEMEKHEKEGNDKQQSASKEIFKDAPDAEAVHVRREVFDDILDVANRNKIDVHQLDDQKIDQVANAYHDDLESMMPAPTGIKMAMVQGAFLAARKQMAKSQLKTLQKHLRPGMLDRIKHKLGR